MRIDSSSPLQKGLIKKGTPVSPPSGLVGRNWATPVGGSSGHPQGYVGVCELSQFNCVTSEDCLGSAVLPQGEKKKKSSKYFLSNCWHLLVGVLLPRNCEDDQLTIPWEDCTRDHVPSGNEHVQSLYSEGNFGRNRVFFPILYTDISYTDRNKILSTFSKIQFHGQNYIFQYIANGTQKTYLDT